MDEPPNDTLAVSGPTDYLLDVFKSQPFRRDAQQIVTTDKSLIEDLVTTLTNAEGFLSVEALRKVIEKKTSEETIQNLLVRYIWNLQIYFHNSSLPIEEFQKLYQGHLRSVFGASPQDFVEALISITDQLASPFPAIARFFKAAKLATRLGDRAEDVSITSDIRPVFNKARSEIEGAVVINTMKISYQFSDGSDSIELTVSKKFLSQLRDEAISALGKLEAISKLCARTELPVADFEGGV